MLDEHDIAYDYREYTKDPLTVAELRDTLGKLGVGPRDVLRLDDDALIAKMAEFPRLLQRPIGVVGDRAVVGRPAEALLSLIA